MANRSAAKSIDLQELITQVARVELKAVNSGIECWQVWINQVAKLSNIASDTLQAIQDDKASLSDTARRLTAFGKDNTEVLRDLSSRLSKQYFDELERLADVADKNDERATASRAKRTASKKTTRKARASKDAHSSA
jgi:hypothetical protein